MKLEELVLSALEAECREADYNCMRSRNALFIPAIGLEIFARDPGVEGGPGKKAVSVTFEARGRGETTDGIKVFQIGRGQTDFIAARDASCQWLLGVYPALESFFVRPGHRCDVEQAHMIVRTDTGEQIV
jgi:hypothetical protein